MKYRLLNICFFFLSLYSHQLIDVKKINNTIVIDLRYATTNNFTGKKVYPKNLCYIHQDIAPLLNTIQNELNYYDLGLKIWDAYRSIEAQQTFWNIVHDSRYVSHPTKGRRVHLRGVAVDVTLVNLKTGKELLMPSEFDDFSEKAYANYVKGIPAEAIENRQKLHTIMTKHGFIPESTEWWHFNIKNWGDYPILNITFEELE